MVWGLVSLSALTQRSVRNANPLQKCPSKPSSGGRRRFVPDIQVCGTRDREDLVNAVITLNAEDVGLRTTTAMLDLKCG